MATHSNILALEIPWTEEPGGLQSTGPPCNLSLVSGCRAWTSVGAVILYNISYTYKKTSCWTWTQFPQSYSNDKKKSTNAFGQVFPAGLTHG